MKPFAALRNLKSTHQVYPFQRIAADVIVDSSKGKGVESFLSYMLLYALG